MFLLASVFFAAMEQQLLAWASQRGGAQLRAYAVNALEANSSEIPVASMAGCPLTDWFLEMWGVKQLSAIEVLCKVLTAYCCLLFW